MTETLAAWLDAQSATADLRDTILAMADAATEIADALRRAPIEGRVGIAGTTNVQGEVQKPLDLLSNDIVVRHLEQSARVSSLVSEELEAPLGLDAEGTLVVACDPLDGSSNLDVNVTVGTIFAVFDARDGLLQPGTAQRAAGYAAYGNSTSFVVTLGKTVAVFTLADGGDFVLTLDEVRVPRESAEYAINTARARFWDAPTRRYVEAAVAGETGPAGKRYNMRWVGSMVADIHRILMRGGIFLYPLDSETRDKGGRLRLLYEAFPMAMLIETAGGRATTGPQRLLDLVPRSIHQRVPVILGSAEEVERIEALYAGAD